VLIIWQLSRTMQELTEQLNSTQLPQPILALKPPYQYTGWSYVTEAMVTIRSPCCGYNLAWCVELKCAHFWSCSHKIESVSIRKCPYDHWLTNEAYLSAITVTSIFRSFTYKMAAKTGWHRYGTKLRHCHPMYSRRSAPICLITWGLATGRRRGGGLSTT